jgi:capsular exopolysaccharide synthesis family protein
MQNGTIEARNMTTARPARGGAERDQGAGELLTVLSAVWRRKIIVVLVAATCLLGAAIYCFCVTPLYRGVATIEVAPQEQNVIRIDDVTKLALNQLDVLNTLVLKSTRETVLRRVVQANNLTRNPAFFMEGRPPSEGVATSRIAAEVKAALRRNTRLIDIVAVDPDPQIAQLLANGAATQFIRQEVEDQTAATRFANVSLLEEADRLKGELERSERVLQNYREEHKSVSLEDRQNIVAQKLHALVQELNDARAELAEIAAQQEQAAILTNTDGLLALPAIKKDAVVAGLQEQVAQQETLVNFYTARYREKYPKLIEARQRLDELKRSVAVAALEARKTLNSVVEAARSKTLGVEKALAEAQTESLALSKLAINYNMLERVVDSNRILYQAILQRLKETEVSKGIEKTSLQMIEPSSLPIEPYRPNRRLLLLLGLFGGIALGVGMALALAQFDQSITSAEDAEQKLGLPALGLLVFDRQLDRNKQVLAMNTCSPMLAEGFRSLRANIAVSARPDERRIVLFTGSAANEGKTTVACNYAVALAQQHIRTLIIDLDLRHCRVGGVFGFESGLPGVSDYLQDKAPLKSLTRTAGIEGLDVICAGHLAPNPAELLAGPNVERLLKEARDQYDVVILDTAPINPVSDTLSFVRMADMVLLTVCSRYTSLKAAQRAIAVLRRAGVRPAGLILNRMPVQRGHYDYVQYKETKVGRPLAVSKVQSVALNTLTNAATTTNKCSIA